MIERIGHVAIGVADLDERIQFFTGQMGMHLKRRGTHNATGGRIAFLADASGFKLELIETPDQQTGLMHIALIPIREESVLTGVQLEDGVDLCWKHIIQLHRKRLRQTPLKGSLS